MSTSQKATVLGMIAIGLWASLTALLRVVSNNLPVLGSMALIYTGGTLLQILLNGWPKLRQFPKGYLGGAAVLFVCYELCMSLSVGFAQTNQQAIEVSMLNYLWPALTVLFLVWSQRKVGHFGLYIGILLCLLGELMVVGQGKISLHGLLSHVYAAPLSYLLASTGAILWAVYCVLTKHYSKGHDGIVFFFSLVALSLWIQYALSDEPALALHWHIIPYLISGMFAMGLGYAAWNKALLGANVTLLAILSYFIPVFSAAFAAWVLDVELSLAFWQGCLALSLGSLLCWWVTRARKTPPLVEASARQQS